MPSLDGVASVLIGVVLAASAALLARETKGLLIGEAADVRIVASMLGLAAETEGVAQANGIITLHLAPTQIVVALSLEFADELRTTDIEARVADLESRLRAMHPEVVALFVKPQTASGFADGRLRRTLQLERLDHIPDRPRTMVEPWAHSGDDPL